MAKNTLASMIYPVLAAGVVLGLIASRNAPPPVKDDFSLVGEQSPWHSEWVLALSDCTACSAKTLDLQGIERKIGSKTLLLALNRSVASQLQKGRWAAVGSQAPASEFGARLIAIVPRLLRLDPNGKVILDVPGIQPIRETIESVRR